MKPFPKTANSNEAELPFTGNQLSEIGQQMALESADAKIEKWSERAYALLLEYVRIFGKGHTFQGEDARQFCEAKGLDIPPSNHAYGSLIVKLAKNKLIKGVGYANVSNPKAHCTPSRVWEVQ